MAQNEWESFKGFSTRKRVKRENRSDFYHIQDTNNQLHLVWGCATLDREMERVKVGDTAFRNSLRVGLLIWFSSTGNDKIRNPSQKLRNHRFQPPQKSLRLPRVVYPFPISEYCSR